MGPLRIWRDGVEVDAGPPQQRCLLALLVARAGHPISTAELTGLIWGDEPPNSAVNAVHKYVSLLRRLLAPDVPSRSPNRYLSRDGGAYRFTAGPETLDLVAFRQGVAAARLSDDPDRALDHYVGALSWCRGPAAGPLGDSVAATTTFLGIDHEFLEATVAAADLAIRVGQPARVLPALRLAAGMEPFNEPVHAALIGALAAAGQQAGALDAYREIRDRLATDLGIDPGPALREAQERVLERTAPAPPRPAQLPPDLPQFTGRSAELATLDGLLAGPRTGPLVVALDGRPGVGKSALAVHFGWRVADRFPDGQLHLDLAGATGDEAVRALLYALGVPVAEMPDTFAARVGAYRSRTAGKRILVLLDNVREPDQARPLLPSSPGSLVLLTGRRPLLGLAARNGAHLLHVDLPDLPAAREMMARRLPGHSRASDEIIERCGRLPSTMAVMAARMTSVRCAPRRTVRTGRAPGGSA